MTDLPTPTPTPTPTAPPYTGTWIMRAVREGSIPMEINDINTFTFDNGIWFVSTVTAVTAIPIANWDVVTLSQDE